MPETTPAATSPVNSSVGANPATDVSTSQATPGGVGAGAATSAGASQAAAGGGTQTQVTGGTSSTQAAAGDYQSVRDALANYGLDLRDRFQDDHGLLQHLVGQIQQAQAAQQLAGYGREFLQHRDGFLQWMRERQEAQAKQQQQQSQWFKAPEYDPRWQSMITRDPATGKLVPADGAPPDIVQKYTAWASHQREFLDKFSQNPIDAIKPGLQQMVQELFQQQFQQQFGQIQQQQAARQVLEQNASWLYEKDQRTGQPKLSVWGERYHQYVQQAERRGLQSVQDVHDVAFAMVERDFLRARSQGLGQQQQPAGDPGAQAKQTFLEQAQQASQQTQQAATPPPGNANGVPANRKGGARGLADAMLSKLQANGYTPEQTIAV